MSTLELSPFDNQLYNDEDEKLSDEELKMWFDLIHAEMFTRKLVGIMDEMEDGIIIYTR